MLVSSTIIEITLATPAMGVSLIIMTVSQNLIDGLCSRAMKLNLPFTAEEIWNFILSERYKLKLLILNYHLSTVAK